MSEILQPKHNHAERFKNTSFVLNNNRIEMGTSAQKNGQSMVDAVRDLGYSVCSGLVITEPFVNIDDLARRNYLMYDKPELPK